MATTEDVQIDKAFVEKVLKSSGSISDANIVISKVTTRPGSNKGDNVTSRLRRIDVEAVVNGNPEKHHLLMKSMDRGSSARDFAQMARLFFKENGTYASFFPALVDLQKERGVRNPWQVPAPKYYAGDVEGDDEFIVLEDLRVQGYVMLDKYVGLTYEEVSLVLQEIARYHAVSYALKKKLGCRLDQAYPQIREVLMTKDNEFVLNEVINSCYQALLKLVEEEREFTDIAIRMKRFDFRGRETICEAYVEESDPWTVACHGDLWTNNILFQYEGKTPKRVAFVDFQLPREVPLTIELSYFLYTSTVYSLRQQHYDDFMQTYHDSFVESLKTIKEPIPIAFTVENLKKEMLRQLPYVLTYMCFAIPMQQPAKEETYDLNNINAKDTGTPDGRPSTFLDREIKRERHMADDLSQQVRKGNVRARLLEIIKELAEKKLF